MVSQSRRMFIRVVGGGLSGAMSMRAQPLVTAGSRRKAKFRKVTKTFTNASPISMNGAGAADLYPSVIQVSGFKRGKVLDVNVTLKPNIWLDEI